MVDEKQVIRTLLERSHLFKSLDATGREELQAMGKLITTQPGEVLIEEGSEGDAFYVLLNGQVEVSSKKGERNVVLANLSRGAVLGEVSLLTGEPRTATVKTVEPCTLVVFLEPGVSGILDRYPKVKELLVRVLVHRAKDTIEKLSSDHSVS